MTCSHPSVSHLQLRSLNHFAPQTSERPSTERLIPVATTRIKFRGHHRPAAVPLCPRRQQRRRGKSRSFSSSAFIFQDKSTFKTSHAVLSSTNASAFPSSKSMSSTTSGDWIVLWVVLLGQLDHRAKKIHSFTSSTPSIFPEF